MKSLLISHIYYPPQVGGISRFLEGLAGAMGPERVCCLTGVPAGPDTAAALDGPPVYRSPEIFSGSTKMTRALSWTRTMGSIMLRERPRAVLLGTVYDGPYGTWLRRWLNLPYVALAHGNEILGILNGKPGMGRPPVHGAWLRGADRVIAVSEFTAGLVRRTGVEPNRVEVVYPGCDSAHFSPRPVNAELRRRLLGDRARDRVILTTGNLVARKGHDMVIRSLTAVRARFPDATYLVVGDGPYRGELEALAVAQGVREHVVFAGQATDEELPEVYALADLFVMASRENESDVEGFGIVFLEAAACGKPVVGGRSGGIPEAVVHGETGWLVDPSDSAQIAEAIVRVLADRESASRMGERGRARVVQSFTWDGAARRIQHVLRTTVEARKSPNAKG